jgi:ABC-2 type transport system permease protein
MGGTLGDVLTEYHILWIHVVLYFIVACLVYRHQVNLARKHAESSEE